MATKLDKPILRETTLKKDEKAVLVALNPSKKGGELVFRTKGSRQPVSISLVQILAGIPEWSGPKEAAPPPPAPKRPKVDPDDVDMEAVDTVNLSALESRLMIDAADVMTQDVKGRLFEIIREMHEEAHEEAGLPKVWVGTKAARQREMRRGSDIEETPVKLKRKPRKKSEKVPSIAGSPAIT